MTYSDTSDIRINRCSDVEINVAELPQEAADIINTDLKLLEHPVYVRADVNGTPKMQIARIVGDHSTVGADCVARCANSIVAAGARPVYFRSFVSGNNCCEEIERAVFTGINDGCRRTGCGLVSDGYMDATQDVDDGEYVLSGRAVGIGKEADLINAKTAHSGDILIGLSSNGIHSSGFDTVTRLFDMSPESLGEYRSELCCSMGDELLKPSRVYVAPVMQLVYSGIDIKAICNIVDGGILGNLPSILPEGVRAIVKTNSYPLHNIFELIQRESGMDEEAMFSTFNMGIGFIIAVGGGDVGRAVEAIVRCGERPFIIGKCVPGERGVELF